MGNTNKPKNIITKDVKTKIFSMDTSPHGQLVFGGSDKKIHIYDFKQLFAQGGDN